MNKRQPETDSEKLTQLIGNMFLPDNVESYFLTDTGKVVAGIKAPDGRLENPHIIDTGFQPSIKVLNNLAKEVSSLKKGSLLKELDPSEYAQYGITNVSAGAVNKKKPKKPKVNKVEAGTPMQVDIQEEPIQETAGVSRKKTVKGGNTQQEIKVSEFFNKVKDNIMNQTKNLLLQGGDINKSYNPDFSIFNKNIKY